MGRVDSTMRHVGASYGPLGAQAGGFVGEALGVPAALLINATAMVAAAVWLFLSPLGHIRSASASATLASLGRQEGPAKVQLGRGGWGSLDCEHEGSR